MAQKKEALTNQINIVVSDSQLQIIKEAAEKQDRPIGYLVRKATLNYIRQQNEQGE